MIRTVKRIYSQDVIVYATIYVVASNLADAARQIKGECSASPTLELNPDCHTEIPVSGRQYRDPLLPPISLSPAMTVGRPTGPVQLVEVITEEITLP